LFYFNVVEKTQEGERDTHTKGTGYIAADFFVCKEQTSGDISARVIRVFPRWHKIINLRKDRQVMDCYEERIFFFVVKCFCFNETSICLLCSWMCNTEIIWHHCWWGRSEYTKPLPWERRLLIAWVLLGSLKGGI